MVYKKGAKAIQEALEARDAVIAEQATRIEQLQAAQSSRPEPAAGRFQDRVRPPQPPEQLSFIAADARSAYVRTNPRQRDAKRSR